MTKNMKKSKNEPGEVSPIILVHALKTTPNQKSLRKASESQKDLMIEYFETHRGAIEVVSSNNTDSEVKRKIWDEVTKILNDVEGGAKKNCLKWSKTWADMKLYAKNRARAAKNKHIAAHGRKPSPLDRRILKVTGHDDLLRDWDASLCLTEFSLSTTYEKIQVDESDDHEVVVTEGTDYEYIDEDELVNEESNVQEAVRIDHYYDTRAIVTQYEYTEPEEERQNKRKRPKEENPLLLEYQEEEGDEDETSTDETPVKRQKQSYEEEEEEVTQEEKQQPDPMVGAINNLATALQSVASAITSFAEIAKGLSKR